MEQIDRLCAFARQCKIGTRMRRLEEALALYPEKRKKQNGEVDIERRLRAIEEHLGLLPKKEEIKEVSLLLEQPPSFRESESGFEIELASPITLQLIAKEKEYEQTVESGLAWSFEEVKVSLDRVNRFFLCLDLEGKSVVVKGSEAEFLSEVRIPDLEDCILVGEMQIIAVTVPFQGGITRLSEDGIVYSCQFLTREEFERERQANG